MKQASASRLPRNKRRSRDQSATSGRSAVVLWFKRGLSKLSRSVSVKQLNRATTWIQALTRFSESARKLCWSLLKLLGVVVLVTVLLLTGNLLRFALLETLPFKSSAIQQFGTAKDFRSLLGRWLGDP